MQLLGIPLWSELHWSWRNGSYVFLVLDLLKDPFAVVIVGVSFDFQNIWVWNELLWYLFSKASRYEVRVNYVKIHEVMGPCEPNPWSGVKMYKGSRSGKGVDVFLPQPWALPLPPACMRHHEIKVCSSCFCFSLTWNATYWRMCPLEKETQLF